MTMLLPRRTIGDRLLSLLGKRRAIRLPSGKHKGLDPYVTALFERESFLRALLRSHNRHPPQGWGYWDAATIAENDGHE